MTKQEAIKDMMARDFAGVPQEWVKIVAESYGEYHALPMWGTMFIVDDFYSDRLSTRIMAHSKDDIDTSEMDEDERKRVTQAIKEDDYGILEDYIDEEMAGADCILDVHGSTTAAFLYEVGGINVIGVNGAGWDFYDGIWDRIYDAAGLKWHDEVETKSNASA